ncbi:glycosyltransferase family 25 protein [Lophiostoma macrostomum CBS 122681]|uniref:Glycosyltransferase family 25 protein n=1 Tax=Lophiostoma macrostomum CBS 122681 TaxID=1314788 RepID=A0A6A6TKK2_9PLEO|nr:glycosyltransferase family 25 protein [Lophiostoma macrostomum CBS 122681]
MLSPSHVRILLGVLSCLSVFLLVLKIHHGRLYHSSISLEQYSYPGKAKLHGIGNDTLGFEKIFVINGPWRTDRKDALALAASYTGITLDFIPGVEGDSIGETAYPPGNHRTISKGNRGSWRAHMNAIREVIERNLTTALILEDDADWDFRLRSQLSDFSYGVRKTPELIAQAEQYHIGHPPSTDETLSQVELAIRSSVSLSSLHPRYLSREEPGYGTEWDILWLGHCGAQFPEPSPHSPNRIMIHNDPTVPEPQYLKPMSRANLDKLSSVYPPHTRVVHQANTTLCTIAYAVTQRGARKLLYEFGIREFNKGFDFALSDYCNALTRDATREHMPMCITVQPPIFGHHFAERGGSDIVGIDANGKPAVETRYVKWSVRMNLERLVRGEDGVVEQWGEKKD